MKISHLQQSLTVSISGEVEGWSHRTQGLKGRKDGLERSNAQMRQLLDDGRSQLKSLMETTLKTRHSPGLSREGPVQRSNLEVGENREAESEHPPGGLSEADLKGLIHAVNVKVSFKRKKKEKEEISRKLHEENQTNEERMGQIKRLQTEQTSLRSENAQLEREIQKLWLKLEMLPELHQEQVRQLLRKSTVEATCRLEVERRCPHVSRRLDYASQKRSLCGKMAEDIERELERAACSGLSELLWRERRARGRWAEPCPPRGCSTSCGRRTAAPGSHWPASSSSSSLSPAGRLFLLYQGIRWVSRLPRKLEGHAGRARGSRLTCRFDAASTAAGAVRPHPQPPPDMCLSPLSIKAILIYLFPV